MKFPIELHKIQIVLFRNEKNFFFLSFLYFHTIIRNSWETMNGSQHEGWLAFMKLSTKKKKKKKKKKKN